MKEKELQKLFQSLTLKEKIGQLVQLSGEFFGSVDEVSTGPAKKMGIHPEMVSLAGSVLNVAGAKSVISIQKSYLERSQHKIPLLFMGDIVYGYRTILPIPLGQGATWNPELIQENYNNIGMEASKAGIDVTFSPMVDLVRDPRWGRCLESTGEDPFLNSQFAAAVIKGFQGNLTVNNVATCVKHFAAYGATEGGREYNTVDMSERRLRQDYLPSYKAAVEAGSKLVMTSFNTLDGIPATANKWLLDEILRKEWGFDGVIITDYAAIHELIAHGVAQDEKEAAQLAINATVDIDMKTSCYANQLEPLVREGKIDNELINQAAWRILCLKNELGLFENPYRGASINEEKFMHTDESRTKALQASRESIVLLKNENNILPLDVKKSKIAVIGPYTNSKSIVGMWSFHGKQDEFTSIQDAFEKLDTHNIKFAKGCDYLEDYSILGSFGKMLNPSNESTLDMEQQTLQAVKLVEQSDLVVLALGEHMLQSGEAGSRTELELPRVQKKLLDTVAKTGKPIVLVLFSGRPLVLTNIEKQVDAILQVWFPGSEGGQAIVDVLTGKFNPSGRLTMSFPYSVGQVPLYYNSFNTGRPISTSQHSDRFLSRYLDAPNGPLYPFGYGLSYTKYEYANLSLSSEILNDETTITISVDIQNSGSKAGIETVQLYIQDKIGSVVRPVKELKGFKRVFLQPGEIKKVIFEVNEEMLRFYDKNLCYQSEKGDFRVFVGHSSQEYLEADFTLI
ncbi:beta-glucosidase BglX [Streptococcus henryi]|uniref:beta-glucosidase BglX n=1 Tax=Streptococcus henryi TaxID=439219 RepID=UPI00037C4BB9|nr:beta-glucosidase BglX [Streptococcus henryi]